MTNSDQHQPSDGSGAPQILLLEDDVGLAQILKAGMEIEYVVDHAQDFDEAITLVRQQRYDAVICDLFINEPDTEQRGRGGVTFISALRNGLEGTPEWGRTVPIVAVTGAAEFNGFDPLNTAASVGANATLRKPVDLERLLGVLAVHISTATG